MNLSSAWAGAVAATASAPAAARRPRRGAKCWRMVKTLGWRKWKLRRDRCMERASVREAGEGLSRLDETLFVAAPPGGFVAYHPAQCVELGQRLNPAVGQGVEDLLALFAR